jgi:hypothetical protein
VAAEWPLCTVYSVHVCTNVKGPVVKEIKCVREVLVFRELRVNYNQYVADDRQGEVAVVYSVQCTCVYHCEMSCGLGNKVCTRSLGVP